ncbi:hypothetical protein HYS30_02540 [Candidatus Peregrinibacteria bacterium]|nr:hypothetical protein [Candidatus Peregrinibacteria bacterium]
MKKLSFVVSALGGAVLGYLASNQRLREELTKAKGPVAARKILAGHLQKDGKRIGQDIRSFLESAHVQKKIRGAQTLLQQQWQKAEGELSSLFGHGKSEAKRFTRKALRSARSSVKRVKRLSKTP